MTKTRNFLVAGLLFAAAAMPAAAQRSVIDFAAFRSDVTTEFQALPDGDVYQDGFGFFANFGTGGRSALGTWGTNPDVEREDLFANSPTNLGATAATMWGTQFNEQINVFREDGLTFNLFSIDLAHMYARSYLLGGDLAPITVRFFGFLAGGGGQIFQDCTVSLPAEVGGDRRPELQRCMFDTRWRNLSEFAWLQGNGSAVAHQFTNIDVEVVPEPSTWALMLTGLAGLGAAAKRRRRSA